MKVVHVSGGVEIDLGMGGRYWCSVGDEEVTEDEDESGCHGGDGVGSWGLKASHFSPLLLGALPGDESLVWLSWAVLLLSSCLGTGGCELLVSSITALGSRMM